MIGKETNNDRILLVGNYIGGVNMIYAKAFELSRIPSGALEAQAVRNEMLCNKTTLPYI